MNPQEDGFTLVEVLVSILIFSLISVGAFIALSNTLDARDAATARMDQVEQLAAARRLMAEDFAMLTDRQDRDGLGGFIDPNRALVRDDQFQLTRRGRQNPEGAFPRGDLLRVAWRVEDGRLIRAFLPHENPAQVDAAIDRVVLDGVQAMRVEPLYRDERPRLLTGAQTVLDGDAISITLTHADGATTRHVFALPDV
jgi:general secretion pathway protein J